MRFKYENLEIWQISMHLVKPVYKLVEKFPKEEMFALASQGKRAVTSIPLNIAEGAGRHSKKDFSCFINRAVTSLQEVDTCLKIAIELNYISQNDYNNINSTLEKLYFKMIAFDKSLRKGN